VVTRERGNRDGGVIPPGTVANWEGAIRWRREGGCRSIGSWVKSAEPTPVLPWTDRNLTRDFLCWRPRITDPSATRECWPAIWSAVASKAIACVSRLLLRIACWIELSWMLMIGTMRTLA
jgi:hypothetical protein